MWHTICHSGKLLMHCVCVCVEPGVERAIKTHVHRVLWQICAQKPISLCSMSRITITSRAMAQHVLCTMEIGVFASRIHSHTIHTLSRGATRTSEILLYDDEELQKECSNENSVATARLLSTVHRFAICVNSEESKNPIQLLICKIPAHWIDAKAVRVRALRSTSLSICTYATATVLWRHRRDDLLCCRTFATGEQNGIVHGITFYAYVAASTAVAILSDLKP